MKENKPQNFIRRLQNIFPPKVFLKYLLLAFSIFLVMCVGLFIKNSNPEKYYENRDRFYENTAATNLQDDIRSSMVASRLSSLFIVLPILFVADLILRRKLVSSIILFPALFISLLLCAVMASAVFFSILYSFTERPPSNNDIVVLKDAWIERIDTNGNQKTDTFSLHLMINGDDPRNQVPEGLFAFGGVDICIYHRWNRLTCEHFFHSQNQQQLGQDRLKIGMPGDTTYIFYLETPLGTQLKPLEGLNESNQLRVTAYFVGADAPLVNYTTQVKNTNNFKNFENIGIQKLPNENGLH